MRELGQVGAVEERGGRLRDEGKGWGDQEVRGEGVKRDCKARMPEA